MLNTAKTQREFGKVSSDTFRRPRNVPGVDFEYFGTDEAAPACIPSNAYRPAPSQLGAPAFSRDLPYKAEAPRFTCHGHRLSSLYRKDEDGGLTLTRRYPERPLFASSL